MPPKPFKPPRPSASATSSSSRAKQRMSTDSNISSRKAGKETGLQKKGAAISKKKNLAAREKEQRKYKAREMLDRRLPGLPSLSPNSELGNESPIASHQSSVLEISDDSMSVDEANAGEEEEEEEDDPFASQPPQRKNPTPQPDAQDDPDDPTAGRQEKLDPKLLQVLLQQFFENENGTTTRVREDAGRAVGRYMETFVREAVARCAWAKSEGREDDMGGFLETEDLEKGAPQMILDF
ncbi:CENP-S associating centromere protein X-domain-containing protein [Amylocarpus encephaloides]|uniref:CENP-S associating centromere protein X-domain-containing protein n=1 Tax=Amylocarpus encephaloides TaxID=45428 RepID=A0A9P7YMG1_9HELO|nr:CENP-S associating centromere protein X-domain-containing protein [Amylocarpus encephaloides]